MMPIHPVKCHWCETVWEDSHPDALDAVIWCGECDRKTIEEVIWKGRPNLRMNRAARYAAQTLTRFAADLTWGEETHESGKFGLRLKAVAEMTLLFHRGGEWTPEDSRRWIDLQKLIGMDTPAKEATTRTLCNAVRFALGDAASFCRA